MRPGTTRRPRASMISDPRSGRSDPTAAKPDIGDLVAPVCRIDDPAALEDEIQHRLPLSGQAYTAVLGESGLKSDGKAFNITAFPWAFSPRTCSVGKAGIHSSTHSTGGS